MMDAWQNMTARERLLVSAAALVTLLVLVYFALVRPLNGYVRESESTLAYAQATYAAIMKGAAEVEALAPAADAGSASADAPSVRVAVARSARENGVSISRLQPGGDQALSVWVESVPSTQFYGWIGDLTDTYGIAPSKVIVQKTTSEGRLRVQLQFGAAS